MFISNSRGHERHSGPCYGHLSSRNCSGLRLPGDDEKSHEVREGISELMRPPSIVEAGKAGRAIPPEGENVCTRFLSVPSPVPNKVFHRTLLVPPFPAHFCPFRLSLGSSNLIREGSLHIRLCLLNLIILSPEALN